MSRKIGSKLAESVKQSRGNPTRGTARAETSPSTPSRPAADASAAAKRPAPKISREPAASHGVLHPSRIWPD